VGGEQSVLCNAKLILGRTVGPPSVVVLGAVSGQRLVEPDFPMERTDKFASANPENSGMIAAGH
jgi:hypothetical protein